MKKISANVLFVIGLIIEIVNPFSILIIRQLFPNQGDDLILPVFYGFLCLGVVLFTLFLAKKRIEIGEIKKKKLISALTPAQICLIVSTVALEAGVLLGSLGSEVVGGILSIAGMGGIGLSIVLAVIFSIRKAIKIIKEERKRKNANKIPRTAGPRYPSKEYCERCGEALSGIWKTVNGHKYCKSCMAYMKKMQDAEECKEETKCCGCGSVYEKSKMIFVDDRYFCENCFRTRYAGSVPVDAGAETGVSKTAGRQARKTKRELVSVLRAAAAKRAGSRAAYGAVETDRFDRDAFTKAHKSAILPHLPRDMEDLDTQKQFLQALAQVMPDCPIESLIRETALHKTAVDTGQMKKTLATETTAQKLEEMLQTADLAVTAKNFQNCTNEQLIKAYMLLDFYAFVLKPEASANIRNMRAYIGIEVHGRLPEDHLTGSGRIDPADQGRREEGKPDLSCETADDNACGKEERKQAISYIRSLDSVFVTFVRATSDKIPSLDGQGDAWLFSKKEYAEEILRKNPGVGMFYREFDQEGLRAFVKSWYRYGILRFKLDPGTGGRFADVERDDFLPIEGIGKWEIMGSALNQGIIRFKQNNAVGDSPAARAAAMTMWSFLCHELYRSFFLVPITYDGAPYAAEDRIIHTSASCPAEEREDCPAFLRNKALICGSEKYHFAKDGEAVPGRIMHLQTLVNSGTTFLCGFTDFEALHKIFGETVSVAILSYEEIIAHLNDAVSDGAVIRGFVINPGTNDLILSRENIAYAAKEKDAPGKFYTPDGGKEG